MQAWVPNFTLTSPFSVSKVLDPSSEFHYCFAKVAGTESNQRNHVQGFNMSRVCQVTGKAPMVGHNVSHANNKTKRRFMPNLQYRKFWVESESRWVRLRLTNAGLRLIDKKGIDAILVDVRARGLAV